MPLRPDLKIEPLRGNLDTRLRKLDEGQYDAIVLAAAGLKRLGLESRIRAVFEPGEMLPAAGQGALGIEVRSDRADLREALAPLVHQATWLRVAAERAVSRAMGGSCSMPLAAYATSAGRAMLHDGGRLGRPGGPRGPGARRCGRPPWRTLCQPPRRWASRSRPRLRADGVRAGRPVRWIPSNALSAMRVIVTRPAARGAGLGAGAAAGGLRRWRCR